MKSEPQVWPDEDNLYYWSGVNPPSNVVVWPDEDNSNPVIGRIFGPKGELLKVVRPRAKRKVGFIRD